MPTSLQQLAKLADGWPKGGVSQLRAVVADVIDSSNVVVTTNLSAVELVETLTTGSRVIPKAYRPQLDAMGTIAPGATLDDVSFATVLLKVRTPLSAGDVQRFALPRYGELAIVWNPDVMPGTRLSPRMSGDAERAKYWAQLGLSSRPISDTADVFAMNYLVTEGFPATVTEGSRNVRGTGIRELLFSDDGVGAVRNAVTGQTELVVSPARPSSIAALVREPYAGSEPLATPGQLAKIRTWSDANHVPLFDVKRPEDLPMLDLVLDDLGARSRGILAAEARAGA